MRLETMGPVARARFARVRMTSEAETRVRCGATRHRDGKPCEGLSVPGKTRCRFHGGSSTGPKSAEGKARALANLRQYRPSIHIAPPPANAVTTTTNRGIDMGTTPSDNTAAEQPTAIEQAAAQSARSARDAAETADNRGQIARRLADLEAAEVAARTALEEAVADLGEAAISPDPDKTADASDLVAVRQQDLQRAQAAREALDRHMMHARERAEAAAIAAKWDAYAEALERRHEAFSVVEEAAGSFFAALDKAISASRMASARAPVSTMLTPDGWLVLDGSQFARVESMKAAELADVRNALWGITKKSQDAGAALLRAREFDKPGAVAVARLDDPRANSIAVEPTPVTEP